MRLNIKTKLILISFALLIIPSTIIGLTAYNIAEKELNQSGATGLKNDVKLVHEMIASLDKEVKKGTLSLEEAQERVKTHILGEKDGEGKRPINPSIDLGEYGYYFVLDDQGNTLAHPVMEGSNLWEAKTEDGVYFIQDMVKFGQNGGGYTYYEWPLPNDPDSLASKITYSEKDPHWGWIVAAGSYMQDYNSGANRILQLLLITLAVFLIAGLVVIYFFARSMANPIMQMTGQMKQLADGDLSVSKLKTRSRDEIGQLSAAMNTMVDNFKSLIKQTSGISERVAASSEELTTSSNQMSQGIEQVSATSEELAAGATTQAEYANNTLEIIQVIDREIKQINQNTNEMEQNSQRGNEASVIGAESARKSIQQMRIIEEKVSQSADVVFALSEKSKEISEILKVINEIAEQTNLLALNAAIEAARAGEQGRGFAVVADEVRKLAEQAGKSTNQIAEIVKSVLVEADQAGDAMKDAVAQVKEGSTVIESNGQTFEEISKIIEEMVTTVKQVSTATEQITTRVEDGVKAVEEIAAVTEESSAGTEELSASMQQQNASMQQINSMAEDLSKMAEELNESLSKFKY